MKKFLGTTLVLVSLVLTACGRDDQQGGAPYPNQPGAPIEQPADDGYYTGGGVGGYCGFLCRWRLRRQQRRNGCWYAQ